MVFANDEEEKFFEGKSESDELKTRFMLTDLKDVRYVNTYQQNKKLRDMLEKEFKYYLTHQSELLPQYNGKFIVIVGENVVGAYSDRSDAYYSSLEKYAPGTFMIQLCTPGDSAYTVRYYNRVSPVTVSAQ